MGYVKPGAAVSLEHDYDGQTHKDELETFTLTLQHIYDQGYITARLLNTSGLQVQSDTYSRQISLQPGSSLNLPVQFSAANDGTYYLGVEVVYESLDGNQSLRVLSVPIIVGAQNKQKGSLRVSEKTETVTLEGVIALPAQETIR